jgi:hypothetical protein
MIGNHNRRYEALCLLARLLAAPVEWTRQQ